MASRCLLCNSEATITETAVGKLVNCPGCCQYILGEKLFAELPQEADWACLRSDLASAVRWRFYKGEPVTRCFVGQMADRGVEGRAGEPRARSRRCPHRRRSSDGTIARTDHTIGKKARAVAGASVCLCRRVAGPRYCNYRFFAKGLAQQGRSTIPISESMGTDRRGEGGGVMRAAITPGQIRAARAC